MPWAVAAAAIGAGATIYSANKASDAASQKGSAGSGNTSQTVTNAIDPRMAEYLYGKPKALKDGAKPTGTDANGNPTYAESDYTAATPGLLSQNLSYLNQEQTPGMQIANKSADNYVGYTSAYDLTKQRDAALGLMDKLNAPQMQAAQGGYTTPTGVYQSALPTGYGQPQKADTSNANVSLINSPGQNNLGLNSAYNDIIYGDLGNNPYLTGSIQKGLNQSANQFNDLQNSMTKNFTQNIMPSIRGDAIVNGQYGGSRQGIAEGKAADAYATQLAQALSQVGQNNTDAAVQAQAGAYNQDRANQLNAVSNLSGQQYGVAGQNAGYQNQNSLSNAQMNNNMSQFNANSGNNYLNQQMQNALQNNQFNANAQNSSAQQQYAGNQGMNLANLGNQQGANQYNAGLQASTNQQNSQNAATGTGLLGNIQNNAYTQANNAYNTGINRAQQVNSLISPYANLGNTQSSVGNSSSTQPMYSNTGSNLLGGAMAGVQLYNTFGNSFGNNTRSSASNPVNTNWGSPSTTYNVPDTSGILNGGW